MRQAARWSGGLKSLRPPDEGGRIQRRGVDGQSIDDFAEVREAQLDRLHEDLRDDAYRPQPVRQKRIPKAGKPGAHRELGIPTVYDRVCQQALLNRLEPIFEPVFDDASFGYRRGRSQHDALRKVWKELESGCEWVVDGDLSDFFGTVDHDKLLTLVAQRVSDGRVLRLIRSMLKAGSYGDGRLFPTEKTRVVDLSGGREGFDFLGCHLRKRMSGPIWSRARRRVYYLHRWPSRRAMKQVRARVRALTPRGRCHTDLRLVIADVNRAVRGWGQYFRTGNAANHFVQLDRYVEERLRGLLLKRGGSRLAAGRAQAWRRPFFEALGLVRLRGTIRYPGAVHAAT